MDTPTYNAEGFQTWKPQPGEYYKLGLKQRESYGGIIAALNDVKVSSACGINKAYPHNFAGIIAAIEDLADCIGGDSNIDIGPYPPGWEIIINPDGSIDGNWIVVPKDGNLWFDTRQGRLFVSIDGQYWQTNGGDGLAYVGDNVPQQQAVIGSTWYDTYNKILYVWTDEGLWEAVKGADDVGQTTATLPLAFKQRLTAGGGGGASILPGDFPTAEEWPAVLPPLDLANQNVQADFNEWLLWSLVRVGEQSDYNTINFGPEPPSADQVLPGSLWYDTNALELSVWYSDGDSEQWVPTSVSYQYDEQLARIESDIAKETQERTTAIEQIKNSIEINSTSAEDSLETLRSELQEFFDLRISQIDIPEVNLEPYSTVTSLTQTKAELEIKINDFRSSLQAEILEAKESLSQIDTTLIDSINEKVSLQQLTDVAASIPDISDLISKDAVTDKIAAITSSFLPRNGGILNGSFVLQKDDISLPALDFTRQTSDGQNALMLRAFSDSDKTVSFGTTEIDGEVAFTFDNNEDFCWIFNNTEKVFSVDRNGPAASNLYLGDFGDNSERGRTLHNKIDVRDRLETYQSAFEEMRQGISNSTNFEELKSNLLSVLASV